MLPAAISEVDQKTYVVDVSQVIAGRLRVVVEAASGQQISFEHSEVLMPDGTFFNNVLGPNKDQRDFFVAAGSGSETYEPTFTFHGFRYARLSSEEPFRLVEAHGIVLASDLTQSCEFTTSGPAHQPAPPERPVVTARELPVYPHRLPPT